MWIMNPGIFYMNHPKDRQGSVMDVCPHSALVHTDGCTLGIEDPWIGATVEPHPVSKYSNHGDRFRPLNGATRDPLQMAVSWLKMGVILTTY